MCPEWTEKHVTKGLPISIKRSEDFFATSAVLRPNNTYVEYTGLNIVAVESALLSLH